MRAAIPSLLALVSLATGALAAAENHSVRQVESVINGTSAEPPATLRGVKVLAVAANDEVSVWQRHSRVMTTVFALLLVQAGVIVGLLIHRRRRLDIEAALKRSEERYREVVESQTEMVCRYRPDTTLTFVNEAYCRFFGKAREE